MVIKLFRWQALALAVWLISLVGGLRILWGYETTPGVQLRKSSRIRNTNLVQLASQQPTLIMFAHPQCPCTKASLLELQDLERKLHGLVKVKVFFIRPVSKDRNWLESSSWALAKTIPGAEVSADPQGTLARMFNAQVSGETVLYSTDGELLFEGGVTPSRGHVGENHGTQAIIETILTGRTSIVHTPIYGCALFSEEQGKVAWK